MRGGLASMMGFAERSRPAGAPARTSIRRSLARVILLTTMISLGISSLAMVALDVVRHRESAELSLRALADVIGTYSLAGLDPADAGAGDRALAPLAREETIVAAALYGPQGDTLASYERRGEGPAAPRRVPVREIEYRGSALHLALPIVVDGGLRGHVYLQKELSTLRQAVWQSAGTIIAVMLLALLLASVASSRAREWIAGPLEELAQTAAAMESGDLSLEAGIDRDDELGRLAAAFDRTRIGLRSLVSSVREHALAIDDDARILSEESEGLSLEARRQAATVEETGAAIERVGASASAVRDTVDGLSSTAIETASSVAEFGTTARRIDDHMDALLETVDGSATSLAQMSAAIRQIGANADTLGAASRSTTASVQILRESVKSVEANAKECDALSATATESAGRGSHVVDEAIDAMEQIQASFQGLERIVSDLSARSEVIEEVVKVIQAVVAETNLLALNASIISSHAGEHGRAFAVVAEEVKNLADRTAGSTREIAEAMDAVRGGIEDAVAAVGEGAEIVQRGVSLSTEAGRALEEIRAGADESTGKVGDIVGATAAQSRDIDTVERAMQELLGGVEQITVGTHEQDKVASELLSGVEQIRQLAREVKNATSEQSRQSSYMANAADALATGVSQILAAAETQHGGIESIVEAVRIFRENTAENGRRAEALRECVESLSGRAELLGTGVRRFVV